eukprot:1088745-Amphidinium_carterae.1
MELLARASSSSPSHSLVNTNEPATVLTLDPSVTEQGDVSNMTQSLCMQCVFVCVSYNGHTMLRYTMVCCSRRKAKIQCAYSSAAIASKSAAPTQ